jgi:putative aldouronate transport system substrate-binding protein
MQVPENYEDYYKVLQAFTFNDPNGNGKKDTYGFTTPGTGTSISTDWPENVKNLDYVDKAVQGNAGIVLGNTADFTYDSNPNSLQSRSKAVNGEANWYRLLSS